MEPIQFNFYPLKGHEEQTNRFVESYELVNVIFLPDKSNKREVRKVVQKKCRFCSSTSNENKFDKDAHLIPEMLGNKTLYSAFECNPCNEIFGRYENELANFLGILRTIHGIRVKDKYPKFTSADNILRAERVEADGKSFTVISREDVNNDKIMMKDQDGSLELSFTKAAFVPLLVYKAFLKMALSVLEENEVKENYQTTLRFLTNEDEIIVASGCVMSGYYLPYNYNLPFHALVFKKKDVCKKVHTHLMVFYFQNVVIALPVLFHKDDSFIFTETITVDLYPPLFSQFTNTKNLKLQPFVRDFSSLEKVKQEAEGIFIEIDQKDWQNTKSCSLEFMPDEIVKVIMR